MHRVFSAVCLLLAVCVLLCGTGCGGSTEDSPGTTDTARVEEGSEKELTEVREGLIKMTETEGLGEITKLELYENGVRIPGENIVQARDNKKIYTAGTVKRVVNYADGYMLDIPADWQPDFSLSTARCKYTTDEITLHASNEDDCYRHYQTAENYIDTMFQYVRTDSYIEQNAIEKLDEQTVKLNDEYQIYLLKLHLTGLAETVKSYYTYAVIYDGVSRCVQLTFKAVDDRDFRDVIMSFKQIVRHGSAVDNVAYPRKDNPSWNEETTSLYREIAESPKVTWGVFSGELDVQTGVLHRKSLENRLDFEFPILSHYTELGDFPLEEARQLHEEGRRLQFTYHFDVAEEKMGEKTTILDVYRGLHDEDMRKVARDIVAFGHPVLFRLNNEMNTDWCPWSANNTMLDPEIFTETWIRMYRIFEEEGANAYCIWIWNPQSESHYPPCHWGSTLTYMPGSAYVDMLGLTSYNFGSETSWNTFSGLYGPIHQTFQPLFGDWAWIISEFGCSDTGTSSERKAEWISEMFDCFEENRYPQIKAAVWFSVNDYFPDGGLQHRLVLDESNETIEAFRDGLNRTQ